MPAERLIKKYPNRRLYDTAESRYITLDEVREMVLKEIPFKVIDRQSEEDITRNILHSRKVLNKTHKNRKIAWMLGRIK